MAKAVDVHVQALRVEGHALAPGVSPEFFGGNEAPDISDQTREDQKLLERKLQQATATFYVVISMFDSQVAVIINIIFSSAN